MNHKIEDFLKENPPKYPIREFEEDILILLQKGCTQVQIIKYLKEKCNFDCTRQTLSKHIQHMKLTNNKARAIKKKNESSLPIVARAKMDEDEFIEKLNKIGG